MVRETSKAPSDKEKEKIQDIELNKRREILDNYFNRNYDDTPRATRYKKNNNYEENLENTTNIKPFKDSDSDPLEKTSEIDNVGIEELKKLVAQLKELDYDNEEEDKESSKSTGKVLTKVAPGYKKTSQDNTEIKPNDNKEIGTSFMYCFILSLITAVIGTGWILNIINHL